MGYRYWSVASGHDINLHTEASLRAGVSKPSPHQLECPFAAGQKKGGCTENQHISFQSHVSDLIMPSPIRIQAHLDVMCDGISRDRISSAVRYIAIHGHERFLRGSTAIITRAKWRTGSLTQDRTHLPFAGVHQKPLRIPSQCRPEISFGASTVETHELPCSDDGFLRHCTPSHFLKMSWSLSNWLVNQASSGLGKDRAIVMLSVVAT
jgi:hypothetical protein